MSHDEVAAHAHGASGVEGAARAGVDSIEHGNYIADEDLRTMVKKGIWYVPTIYVGEYVAAGRANAGAGVWLEVMSGYACRSRSSSVGGAAGRALPF